MCGCACAGRLGALIGALRARAGERGFKAVSASQTQNLFLVVRREWRLHAAPPRVYQITDPILAVLQRARAIDRKFGELGCRQPLYVRTYLSVEHGVDALTGSEA